MKFYFLMARNIVTVYKLGQTDLNFKVNTRMTKNMVMENSLVPITKFVFYKMLTSCSKYFVKISLYLKHL